METIIQLMSQGKLDVKSLITHRYSVDDAAKAYELIEGVKTEPYLGILLNYAESNGLAAANERIEISPTPLNKGKINVSFYGAGNYATASLIPPLDKRADVQFRGLVTASGRSAQGVANKYGFAFCTNEFSELISKDTDCIMITTRHDTHAGAVAGSVEGGKHVYVEKPLALNIDELVNIHKAHLDNTQAQIMVGFNRRFAPATEIICEHFSSVQTPLVVNIRVNAGEIPTSHWIQDPLIGGGRMIGEGCHFIDLAAAITGSNPKSVYALGSTKAEKTPLLNDNLCITVGFENGSVANITYTADGSKAMAKEYVEVFGGGRSAELHDFKEVVLYQGDSIIDRKKLGTQDKGQLNMLDKWISGIKTGEVCIDYNCLMTVSMASIMVVESMTMGMPIQVNLSILEQEINSYE